MASTLTSVLVSRRLSRKYVVQSCIVTFLLTFCLQHFKPGVTVWLESENGILGMGPYPTKDEVDACVNS